MRKLRIGIIDLAAKGRTKAWWDRVIYPNYASIMPQVIGVWCEEQGHHVTFVCYTGFENLVDELPDDVDLVFIGSFTQTAQLAYALSNLFRKKGAVTVLGGPHARCYPQDAQQYFDYVLGFSNKEIIRDVLSDCSPHRPIGIRLAAKEQPTTLPGARERWKFIEPTLKKAIFIKCVPMLNSLGCPYTCSFCIDSVVPYQPLEFDVIKEDLRFLLSKFKRPHVSWHDPNFGIRFNDIMEAIEEAVPPDSISFIAESSLSVLTEPHLKRMQRNGFKAILPGIESWYDMGNKSKSGKTTGIHKVRQVSEHVNTVLRYIPFVQTNFVFGLDFEEGPEPFELTKQFVELTPGVYPSYLLLTAYGEAAPLNLEYQRDNRVLPVPFHFLNNNHATNVVPKQYSWLELYDHLIDLAQYSLSWRAARHRFHANKVATARWAHVLRTVSSEGWGLIKHYMEIRKRLNTDPQFRRYFEQETTELPSFYVDQIRKDLGPLWEWLPDGAMHHDPLAYLKSTSGADTLPDSLHISTATGSKRVENLGTIESVLTDDSGLAGHSKATEVRKMQK